jgi:hypothetical protein
MFGPIPAWGFYCRHARNIKLQEIDLTLQNPDKRSAFLFEDVEKLKVTSVDAERSEGAAALMHFRDAKKVVLSGCDLPKDLSTLIDVPADQKNEIQMIYNYRYEK